MMDAHTVAQLRLQILQVLEDAPSGHNLDDLHALLCRSRRDASMLPAISALIGGGYCEKVHAAQASAMDAGDGNHRSNPAPVRFRLTPAGRALLHPGAQAPRSGRAAPERVAGSDRLPAL